jgi:hypothetical protein
MPPKKNPLKLNPLQLKTLTLLQELARDPRTSSKSDATGETLITLIPQLHGNHIHIGQRVAMARDANGLWNQAVWNALARRGLAYGTFPVAIRLTPDGLAYETGLRDKILYGSDH